MIEEVQIALDLTDRPGATLTPTNLAARLPGQVADRPLPSGTSIVSVYDEQAQALLILGAPGAGKTTLLLDLAETLLNRAEQDATHPIPVVFNLSSWDTSRPSFDVWLVEQLNQIYDVPRKLGQAWVAQGLILLLLDGLDEVASAQRAACVDAVNTYRQREAGLQPLVVCCREAEYQALPRLRLHGAVVVQPLTQSQVEDYLSELGLSVAVLRAAVKRHPPLVEMLATPLMLNIVTLVYRGQQAPSPALAQSEADWRDQVFAAYVTQALQRRIGGSHPETTIRHSLSWLAWQMQQRSQSVFLIENLQPDWLQTQWGRCCYYMVSVLVFGLGFGLVTGLVAGLLFGLVAGLVIGFLYYGGQSALQHLSLRFFLWRSGVIPWNLAAFLDACADRILLRKVGGGYVFIHRMLLEWFAAQYQPTPEQRRQADE